jgi:uncharacterized protein YbaA (DUF1428 family)
MDYADGFVLAVPKENKEAYIAYADSFAAIFKEYGASSVVECWGDDIPDGETTSFPLAVKCEENETVVFSWMTWPSKEVRDKAWEKMMKDERFSPEKYPMPFDGNRLIYGGFQMIVSE